MTRCAFPDTKSTPSVRCPRASRSSSSEIRTAGSTTQPAPIALGFPAMIPRRDLTDLVRLARDDDRVPRVRATLVAAHEVGILRQQVDDLPLSLVSPLRPDDDRGGHVRECRTCRGGLARAPPPPLSGTCSSRAIASTVATAGRPCGQLDSTPPREPAMSSARPPILRTAAKSGIAPTVANPPTTNAEPTERASPSAPSPTCAPTPPAPETIESNETTVARCSEGTS